MKRVVVTGSRGFIGGYLMLKLRELNVEVIEYDRKIGKEAEYVGRALGSQKIDAVIHLAAQTSVWNEDDAAIAHDNIYTFVAIASACKEFNVPLIYASSSCAKNITSHYGLSKKYCEDIAQMRYSDIAIGIRFHNVYAANPRSGTLPYNLFNDDIVDLYNNGEIHRHFTYIDDITTGIIRATEKAISGDFSCNLYNIYNPEYTSIKDFAKEVQRYRPEVCISLVPGERQYDKKEQNVESLNNLLLANEYTSVSKGVSECFKIRTMER